MDRDRAKAARDNGPKYVRIYNELKGRILSGAYAPNTFLPTEDELVSSLGVSKTTLRHAIAMLRDERLVVVQQGIGMKVQPQGFNPISNEKYKHSNSIRMELLSDGPQVASTTQPVTDIIPAELRVADQLGIEPGEPVNRVQRLQMVDNQVYGYIVDYIPTSLVPRFSMNAGEFFYDVLERDFGMFYESAEETITAVNAGFMEARMLSVEVGSSLLLSRRCVKGPKGVFVFSEDLLNPALFRLAISLGSFHDLEGNP